MKLTWSVLALTGLVFLAGNSSTRGATDPAIDKLLHKLPAPEKIVRPVDPIVKDPLTKKTVDALNAQNFRRALSLSRQLSSRYPKNATARGVHGWVALVQEQYPESASEFRSAVALEPQYPFAYFCLGISEAAQTHYSTALQYFQRAARMEPNVDVIWIASSGCAEKLGRRQESLDYAKRATTIAPKSGNAWLQLAHAEAGMGHKSAADRALARAKQLGATKTAAPKRR